MASFLDNGLIEGVCFLKKKVELFWWRVLEDTDFIFLKVYKWKSSYERDFTQPWVTVFLLLLLLFQTVADTTIRMANLTQWFN